MPSTTVNICVLTLVLLSFQQLCLSRPQSSTKRSVVEDYLAPDSLVLPADKFEKGEDGKYYLKKNAYKSDSQVKYVPESGASDPKASDVETVSKKMDGNTKTETLAEEMTGTLVLEEAPLKPTTPIVVEKVAEMDVPTKTKEIVEKKTEMDKSKAPFASTDPKFAVPSKPDSKDEIPLKTDLPPLDVDEKVDEKITIGQVPHLYPRVIPVNGNFRLPVLVPMRKVSYGSVSVIPIPPVDSSDRLPYAYEDEIVGEGPHESEVSEEIPQPVEEKRRDTEFNPLLGVHLPFLSFRTFIKDLKEADKVDKEKQSKVVDVLGKKFLMHSSVMKHPTSDNSHMFVRFMSVKPLEEVKPEAGKEEAVKKDVEQAERKDSKEMEIKKEIEEEKETVVLKDGENLKESEAGKEAEILKAEETEVKMEINKEVPGVEDPEVVDEMKETKMLSEMFGEEIESDEDAEKDDDMKTKSIDAVKREDKTMDVDSKKSLFMIEKNKKMKSKEESEEHKKSPKKSEKKKKKCKCEEMDSDSDDDDE